MTKIQLNDAALEATQGGSELSAIWNDEKIFFRTSGRVIPEKRGEIFVAPLLSIAMYRGCDIQMPDDLPLSATFAENLSAVQDIMHRWNPALTHIKVHAKIQETKAHVQGALCNYSGGIDGSHSLNKYMDEISDILVINCFDDWKNQDHWPKTIAQKQKVADHFGKNLITVETNIRDVTHDAGVSWHLAHGAVITSFGTLFGHDMNIISSGYSYGHLEPDGSHSLMDPLWSTNRTEVIHSGAEVSRTEKTEAIASNPYLLNALQVCWKSSSHNCGACPKCVRTGIALYLLGMESPALPYDYAKIGLKILKPVEHAALVLLEDIVDLARRVGNSEVEKILLKYRKRYLVRHAFDEFIKAILPNWLGRKLRARQNWMKTDEKINYTPPNRFL